jgi:DNA invertase Pin-like site-specific DNA recombinase
MSTFDRPAGRRPAAGPAATAADPAAGADALSGKIQAWHRERLAVVYVRQSTPQQVATHRESAALQYALVDQAVHWGWPRERVLVLDEDQGHSGRSAVDRPAFQRLVLEVNLDHVGLIVGKEMSRLARGGKDWHHLLEVCAVVQTLLADQDGIYDPNNPSDRLLLGLKGSMSEAELALMRSRLYQGLLHKAQRGALWRPPPRGYVAGPDGGWVLDPDAQVQEVVRLVLTSFARLGTVTALLRYLVQHGIQLPRRVAAGPQRGELQWRPPQRSNLLHLLHHPAYAGAYSFGRLRTQRQARLAAVTAGGEVPGMPRFRVLLRDRLPAYLSWDEYLVNQQRLHANQARAATAGAVRTGAALLAGLLRCGQCRRRLRIAYDHGAGQAAYVCDGRHRAYGAPVCQRVQAAVLDAVVSRQVLRVVTPAALALSVQAAADLAQERERLHQHWQQQRQRAAYAVAQAARQYEAVDAANRLVAAELERRWEEALRAQRGLEEEYDRFCQQQPRAVSEAERAQLQALAQDLPALWATATAAARQEVVRCLLRGAVVTVPHGQEVVELDLEWQGGQVSHHRTHRAVARYDQLQDKERLFERIVALRRQGWTAAAIAAQLHQEGYRPPHRRGPWSGAMVRQLLCRQGLMGQARPQRPEQRPLATDEWRLQPLADQLGISVATLDRWYHRGWVQGAKDADARGRLRLWADADELARLARLRNYRRPWTEVSYPAELITPKPRSPQ